jgi:tetratricopeptide (TPR) repeat protein
MVLPRKLSKKEIKKDPFITAVLNAWEYTREHQGTIFAGLIILVVAIAAVIWMQNSRRRARIESVTQFSEALSAFRMGDVKTAEQLFGIVNEQHGATENGVDALYFIGKCALIEGDYTGAIESFDQYLGKSNKYNNFRDAAMDGKGAALMNQQRYAEAAEVYSELARTIETNTFMEKVYLRRAADNYKLNGQYDRAVEVMKQLLEKSTGVERRDLEVEIAILSG